MRGKKRLLAAALTKSGLLRVARGVRRSASSLAVLAYHRVLPRLDASFSGDEELVSALVDDFVWQLDFIVRYCNAITLDDLVNACRGESELPGRPVLITFDDGCIDSVRYSVPALRSAGLPAIFFVSTGYIGGRELYWFDDVVHRIVRTPRKVLDLEQLALTVQVPADVPQRKHTAAQIVTRLKRLRDSERKAALYEIREACGASLPDDVVEDNRPMTWEEVQQVATDGIQIGSHSVTHPVLAGLDDAQLLRELEVSKAEIERRLDRPCHAVAYPLGGDAGYSVSGAIAVDARVREFAAQCSYRTGFTYVPGVVQLATDDPLLLRRVPVERYLTRDEFAARLSLPGIFV